MFELLSRYKMDVNFCLLFGPEYWKGTARGQIKQYFDKQWTEGKKNKSTLTWYRQKYRRCANPHLTGDPSSKLLARCIAGDMQLDGRTALFKGDSPSCKLCAQSEENETHIVLHCSALKEEREEMMEYIREEWGPEESTEWNSIPEEDQMAKLLGISQEVSEAHIRKVKIFLVKAHKKKQIYNEVINGLDKKGGKKKSRERKGLNSL